MSSDHFGGRLYIRFQPRRGLPHEGTEVSAMEQLGYKCKLLVFIFGNLGNVHRLVVRGKGKVCKWQELRAILYIHPFVVITWGAVPSHTSFVKKVNPVNRGDVAQEVELSSGSQRVAGSIPRWACRGVPEQDT